MRFRFYNGSDHQRKAINTVPVLSDTPETFQASFTVAPLSGNPRMNLNLNLAQSAAT